MKYLLPLLSLTILFSQELEVEGNLKVTGTVESATIDSLEQVIASMQAQIDAMHADNKLETRVYETQWLNVGDTFNIYTDLNIYWLLTGKGPVYRVLAPEMEKSTEQSRLYEDFMFMMQDRKLKGVVEKVIAVYREGDIKKKAQMQGFLSALS